MSIDIAATQPPLYINLPSDISEVEARAKFIAYCGHSPAMVRQTDDGWFLGPVTPEAYAQLPRAADRPMRKRRGAAAIKGAPG